jgi:hypothetical protein
MLTSVYNVGVFAHNHIQSLNNSKFFAGVVLILLNIGSKFIPVQFSKSAEEYLKLNVTKQVIVFSMAWMGTRDIYTALILTAVFTVLSDHLFNEESGYCVVPEQYRVLQALADTNDDGVVSPEEWQRALAVLEKAKKNQQATKQRETFAQFGQYSRSALPAFTNSN